MSVLVLDENLKRRTVHEVLARRFSVVRLPDLCPGQKVLDERVPEILMCLDRPTFVTIDADFWERKLCHPSYCVLFFDLIDEEQGRLPSLLCTLFRHAAFRTRAARMGRVAKVTKRRVEYWEFGKNEKQTLVW